MEAGQFLPELVLPSYRFAWLLAGDAASAEELATESLRQAVDRFADHRAPGKARTWLFARLAQAGEKRRNRPAEPGDTWSGQLTDLGPMHVRHWINGLTGQVRRAVAAHYLGVLSPEEVAAVAGVRVKEVPKLLDEARPRLAADPPTGRDPSRTDVSPDSTAVDDAISAAVARVPLPDGIETRLAAATPQRLPAIAVLRQPVVALSLAAALLVLGGLITLQMSRQTEKFSGSDQAQQLLERLARLTGSEFDPIRIPVENLGDWLVAKGLEGFEPPEELTGLMAMGGRLTELEGHTVVQIAFEEPFVVLEGFQASDINATPDATGGSWRFLTAGEWVGAVKIRDGHGWLVATKGDRADLVQVLETNRAPAPPGTEPHASDAGQGSP